jgi:hypothetical protein
MVTNVFYKEFQIFMKKIDYQNIKKIFNSKIADDLDEDIPLAKLPVNMNNAFLKFATHIYENKSIIQNKDIKFINEFKDTLLKIKQYVLPSKHQEYDNILFYFNEAVNNILNINNSEYKKQNNGFKEKERSNILKNFMNFSEISKNNFFCY